METRRRTLILWIAVVGTILAGLEGLSLLDGDGRFGPYLHYAVYMSLANTFIPLPTNPLIIYMGREYFPAMVAIVGAAGTAVANMTEYLLLGILFETRRAQRVKRTHTYQVLKRYFERSPFLLMVAVNFVPIPVDPVRWMAISVDYPRWRYVLSTFLGRIPRYYLLAWFGDRYDLSNRTILIILAATGVLVLARRLLPHRRNRD
jgi:membrane protein YqaA with SNARE-associated domain